MSRRRLFESKDAQATTPGPGPAYVSVESLRQHLAEFLLYAGRPVVIMRGRSEVGYFLPARCWRHREDDPVLATTTREILDAAGFRAEDVSQSQEEYARMRQRTIHHPRRTTGHGD